MNLKTFGILSIVTVLLIFLALQISTKKSAPVQTTMTTLYPELLNNINDVKEIEIKQQEKSLNLKHNGEQWQLQQQANYPADNHKVNKVLAGIAQMQVIEAKTKNPKLYEKLGVTDSDQQVLLKQADGRVVAHLIIGNSRTAKGDSTQHQVYVRKHEDAQTWLVSGQIDLANNDIDWLQRTLLDLNETQVQSVSFNTSENETLTISKANKEDKDYQLKDLGADEEVANNFILKTTASLLSNLQFDHVLPVTELTFKDKENATFKTFKGLQVQVFLAEKDDHTYMKLVATSTADTSTEDAQKLSKKLSPWAYAIAQYKLDTFKKVRKDFIKQPEPVKTSAETTDNTNKNTTSAPINPFAAAIAASKEKANTPPTQAQIDVTNKLRAALEKARLKKEAELSKKSILESVPTPVVVPTTEPEVIPAVAEISTTTPSVEVVPVAPIEVPTTAPSIEVVPAPVETPATAPRVEVVPAPVETPATAPRVEVVPVLVKTPTTYMDSLKSVVSATKETVIKKAKDTTATAKQTTHEVVEGIKSVADNKTVKAVVDDIKSGVSSATDVLMKGKEKIVEAVKPEKTQP